MGSQRWVAALYAGGPIIARKVSRFGDSGIQATFAARNERTMKPGIHPDSYRIVVFRT